MNNMKKTNRVTVRRVLKKPKRSSLDAGIRSPIKKTVLNTTKRIILPRLYFEGLVLSIVLFGLSILSVSLADKTDRAAASNPDNPGTSIDTILDITSDANAEEAWTVSDRPIIENVTNTSTIVRSDGAIDMFFSRNGTIWRVTSQDGATFSEPVSTGLTEDQSVPYVQRQAIGHPNVLQLTSSRYLMVYEQSVRQRPEVPQIDQPRNLYAATSIDGQTFQATGIVLDSRQNDAGYATDPELLYLPNGSIRLFYTSQGDRIASLISDDGGKSWVREGERLSRISTDADVQFFGSHFAMYYSFPSEGITQNGRLDTAMRIRKAISTDGLTFVKTSQTMVAGPNMSNTVDPDVIIQTNGTARMYFGLIRPGTGSSGAVYDLYSATANHVSSTE